MKALIRVLKEQFLSLPLIIRLAAYETKSKYQMNYLGVLWQFLNPLIQMLAYWFVFGIGIRKSSEMVTGVGEVPFIIWMLAGLIPWFFISPTILDGSNSVYKRINMVAKMNFPISSLPSVAIAANLFSYFVMMAIYVMVLLGFGIYPNLQWLEYIYYLFCMIVFMFAFSLFNSTISVLVRDYQFLLQSVTRLLFFLLPIFWDISTQLGDKHPALLNVIKLNPLFYIIDGFRNSFLGGSWFFEDATYMLYFWLFTFLLLLVGSILHMKFRDKFVDFL
ncbi:teichoic acids export ABC transporter permease subunit TagG [Bacillus paralicheniformis]|jgi:teichoic acid transport system permease protein|uniref:teichoic acids export ABC transporter permease subunit TagG n=1 Tax=Bacillus paralicheniformis TaxID=1648923 RepID=UPI000342433F|nr:teichoic acids export ABC transporter permease subunit TagG [Bacillus paralicheniformis]KJD54949.1 Teichoic acid translocation permease TagG [Bacillus amyloliquefaciens]KUL06618.1 teichoic acid ABC transporter permease [Bacillus licheniformis LMG 7559]AGN38139.1 teichoic acid ABC exporter permease TagG [Bacillus paralicheniformis ATCC 9945a]ARA87420.1 Teichoic acid translocation permease TagG [Bacillus paralicheniformis]AYQ18191.1 teichoic acids export ABC transporter permease subunit TagG 